MLPNLQRGELAELSRNVFLQAGRLDALVPAAVTRKKIAALLRNMNSYYSNLIEGHKTKPRDIERALKQDFSNASKQKNNQLLSLAHIRAQEKMERELAAQTFPCLCGADFLCWLHRAFYHALPDELHWNTTVSGKPYRIVPGQLRDHLVNVGDHTPPAPSALAAFLQRFEAVYSSENILPTNRLIAIAAAHHRLAWIHPFDDGNGRVVRLHSQALLVANKVSGSGLWTLSRGLACYRNDYYRHLATADEPRRGDLDGRGNLSEQGLAEFCQFFLRVILDQIRFMGDLLELPTLQYRVTKYFEHAVPPELKKHAEDHAKLIKYLLAEGEISRAKVAEIIGKSERFCLDFIKAALSAELIETPSPKGKLRINFPEKILDYYFPRLYLDLPVDGGDD
ncbi:MAG: Fic family protein [Verrucomicrobiales bacterium]|jgi:Fic family protein|nr:Fic family protein [Verrucomicrobiales bacterium]